MAATKQDACVFLKGVCFMSCGFHSSGIAKVLNMRTLTGQIWEENIR